MAERYYVGYGSEWYAEGGGWHVLDRQNKNSRGDCLSIARCVNLDYAFAILDALNAVENAATEDTK